MTGSTPPNSNNINIDNNKANGRNRKATRLDDSDEVSSLPFSEGSSLHDEESHKSLQHENERLKLELRAAKAEILRLRRKEWYKNQGGSFSKCKDNAPPTTSSSNTNAATGAAGAAAIPATPVLAGSLLRAANRFPMLASLRNNNNNRNRPNVHSKNKRHDSDSCPSNDDTPEKALQQDVQMQIHASAQGLVHRKVKTSSNHSKKKKTHVDDTSIQSLEPANIHHDDDGLQDEDYDEDDLEKQEETLLLFTSSRNTHSATKRNNAATATTTEHIHHDRSSSSSFCASVQDRASWLVGLLILQSLSSFIISQNEKMLQQHLVIVRFLTMLVGAGGNAGNQASVRVIRGLATGAVTSNNQNEFLRQELWMAMTLGGILAVAGFVRAAVFLTPFAETMAITASLFMIVVSSICLGAILPFGMKYLRIDPAHSSTTIQVLMDILGVTITVVVSGVILNSTITSWLPHDIDDAI